MTYLVSFLAGWIFLHRECYLSSSTLSRDWCYKVEELCKPWFIPSQHNFLWGIRLPCMSFKFKWLVLLTNTHINFHRIITGKLDSSRLCFLKGQHCHLQLSRATEGPHAYGVTLLEGLCLLSLMEPLSPRTDIFPYLPITCALHWATLYVHLWMGIMASLSLSRGMQKKKATWGCFIWSRSPRSPWHLKKIINHMFMMVACHLSSQSCCFFILLLQLQSCTPEWYTTPIWYTFIYFTASPNHHLFKKKKRI